MDAEDRTHARSTRADAGSQDSTGGAEDHPLEAVVEGIRHGIDQVAEKVKGLLRPSR